MTDGQWQVKVIPWKKPVWWPVIWSRKYLVKVFLSYGSSPSRVSWQKRAHSNIEFSLGHLVGKYQKSSPSPADTFPVFEDFSSHMSVEQYWDFNWKVTMKFSRTTGVEFLKCFFFSFLRKNHLFPKHALMGLMFVLAVTRVLLRPQLERFFLHLYFRNTFEVLFSLFCCHSFLNKCVGTLPMRTLVWTSVCVSLCWLHHCHVFCTFE